MVDFNPMQIGDPDMAMNIIISVPFPRNIRHCLAVPFTSELKKYGKLIVISPIEFSPLDKQLLKLDDVEFILLDLKVNRFTSLLLTISDYCRRSGYFGSSGEYGLGYYFSNLQVRFNRSGYFERLTSIVKWGIFTASFLFRKKSNWRLLESLVFKLCRIHSNKLAQLEAFENVTYFQCANWGLQDRWLCNIARELNWKSVLIPYTSDQVYVTGHMLKDHDVYAVQSELEKKFAIDLHHIPEDRVQVIGSLWHRNISYFLDLKSIKSMQRSNFDRKILYAGVGDIFFPRITEINSVMKIAEKFPDCEVQYCPYVTGQAFETLGNRLQNFSNITIIPFSPTITELVSSGSDLIRRDLELHIEKLCDVDVFVMSYLTSMVTEVSYVSECPIIANFIDDFGILKRRNTEEFPKWLLGEQLVIVETYVDLICSIRLALESPSAIDCNPPYLNWDDTISLENGISSVMCKL